MFCVTCQSYLKGSCIFKYEVSLKVSYQNYLQGSEKNHSSQQCLTNILEKLNNSIGKGGFVYAIFMDLSKAFDTIIQDLLLTKLVAYGFQEDLLSFMKSYLSKRQQRVRAVISLVRGNE